MLAKPVRVSIAGHSPIATRRQTYRTDLGTIGHAIPFELVREKPSQKRIQRRADIIQRMFLVEDRLAGQIQDFLSTKSVADEVIQKEIM